MAEAKKHFTANGVETLCGRNTQLVMLTYYTAGITCIVCQRLSTHLLADLRR